MRVLDIGGRCAAVLPSLRADIALTVALPSELEGLSAESDAIIAIDQAWSAPLLVRVHELLRAGGRFIALDTTSRPSRYWVQLLESAGFTRILVEALSEDGTGLLVRGERPHTTADTHARIQVAAHQDHDGLDLRGYRGPYVYLLVRQTPNKPVWQLASDEDIVWQAVVWGAGEDAPLLAFTSLPKAVGFMQKAVVGGYIRDVNKMAKYRREILLDWARGVLLNPEPSALGDALLTLTPINRALAEAPDE